MLHRIIQLKAIKSLPFFVIFGLFLQTADCVPSQTIRYLTKNAPKIGGGYAVTNQISEVGYTSEIYDATNGLPTSDANFILGSKDGYVWICGYSGVIKYDGTTFERLPTLSGLTSGRGIFEDSKNRIWVATNDNGVVVLTNGTARHYTYQDGLPSSSIRIFAEDAVGNIFIGTTSGLCYIDNYNRLIRVNNELLNRERILKLDSDINGKIFGQTKNGAIFEIENCRVSKFFTGEDLGTGKITTIMCDPFVSSKVYIGTEDSTVYYGDFGKPASMMKKIDVSPLKNIHWLSYDCGRVWISSTTQVGWLDVDNKFYELKDIPMNSAIEMTTSDYQGNIWIASTTQGVMKLVTNNFVNLSYEAKLPKATTNTTCLHNGLLYIGTDNGLKILDKNNNQVENALTKFIGTARIRCIVEDSEKNLWLAAYTNNLGLICESPDGKITSISVNQGLLNNQVRTLNTTKDGKIIVGTNGGLCIVKDKKVIATYGSRQNIKNTEFLTVCEGDNGQILCGSDGDGIYIIDGNQIKKIGREEGLASDVVMRIKKDFKNGIYWIVTSNSIQYLKDGVVKNITTFPYNNNYDLYPNNKNEYWILSSYGIYTVKADELINNSIKDYRLYTIANGLPYSITSNSYSCIDWKGNLYISGREGVIRVNIDHYYDETTQIKTDLNSVYCDNQKVFQNIDGSFTLPASCRRIKLNASIMDYSMSNPLVRVFLEGSGDYGVIQQRNELSALEYTGLSYGNYKFHIQVLDNNRRDVLLDKSFDIIKKPRMTELFIFRMIIMSLVVIIVVFIVWRVMKSTVITRQYDEIRQAKDEADRANTARAKFLSNMSQEILTPINTIICMDEMIMREDSKNVPKSYFMSIVNYAFDIRSASEYLLDQINELLEMTKIETGNLQLVQTEYDVVEVLRSVVSLIHTKATQKELKFNLNIDEMLPKRLFGDVGKIKHVLLKLLTNAVRFTDEGSVELSISMETRNDNICGLCFSVKDTGIGIKQEDVEKLFTPFATEDENEKLQHLRAGLGLDISRKFAELMGGVLVCQSVYGEGSDFIFTLTQKIIDPTPIGTFVEQSENNATGPYVPLFIAPDADVLVVDENPVNITVIRELLKGTRVFITTASSCQECLDKIKISPFNIILLDQMLPGTDGETVIQKIRSLAPDIPVYALTENASNGEDFYKSQGFNGCLSIPINPPLLERTIMRHLPQSMMTKPSTDEFIEEFTEMPAELNWIYDIKEINVDEGIKASGGIGPFIFSINLFIDTIDDNAANIEKAYKNGDFSLLALKIRMIKNSAKFIGAPLLYDISVKMEDACKRDDKIYISANIDNLLSNYILFNDRLGRLRQKPEKEA